MRYTARLLPVTGDRPKQSMANHLEVLEAWAAKVLESAPADAPDARVEITEQQEVRVETWRKKGDGTGVEVDLAGAKSS